MQAAILLFPGINRERDMILAVRQSFGREPAIVWHKETELPAGTDLVILPGGFSFGDYLRCGAMAAQSPIMRAVKAHAERGGYVLGVCNGFQILCEAGLLPGALMRNVGLKFICRMQTLRVETNQTRFTRGYDAGAVVTYALAHGEGAYVAAPQEIEALEREGRVAFRYCDATGQASAASNPNGSLNNIAGVYNSGFNVLGLMPHPENLVDALTGGLDGKPLFAALG